MDKRCEADLAMLRMACAGVLATGCTEEPLDPISSTVDCGGHAHVKALKELRRVLGYIDSKTDCKGRGHCPYCDADVDKGECEPHNEC